ncbi:MAG TPA: hypothetical protein VN281_01340 [Verrucomicrobiae bacterium]|nr:hypothetical protein [Verrucomicrobiae bacterium]
MRKVREDSKWHALTAAQRARLEGWLFAENIGYARVVALARQEFGLETSVPGVARYYRRRVNERREMRQETLQAMMSAEDSLAAGREQIGGPNEV